MACSQNSITDIFSVFPLSHGVQSPSLVSLCLVVQDRRRVLFRDSLGVLRVIRDEITGLRPILAPRFDKLDLYRPDAMCTILCDALGLSMDDEDSLYGLGSSLANCALATRSLNLCAKLEVVHNTVVIEKKDVELDTCPICLDELCESVSHTQCSHRFHLDCLVKWLEKKDSYSCPLCRTEL